VRDAFVKMNRRAIAMTYSQPSFSSTVPPGTELGKLGEALNANNDK